MTNREFADRFDQAHGARIERLYWIASNLLSNDLKDMLEEIDERDLKECFPEIVDFSNRYEEYYKNGNMVDGLIAFQKFGFLAEVQVPHAYDFVFKKGESRPTSWTVSEGTRRIVHVYAETPEELIAAVEKASDKIFNGFIEKEKGKKSKKQKA